MILGSCRQSTAVMTGQPLRHEVAHRGTVAPRHRETARRSLAAESRAQRTPEDQALTGDTHHG
jgi:hypothetical protein